jgi:hypothetical protein
MLSNIAFCNAHNLGLLQCERKTKTSDELENEIFEAIKANNFKKIKELIVTEDEVLSTIEASQIPASDKKEFKTQFINHFKAERKQTVERIKDGFKEINEQIDSEGCRTKIVIGKVSYNTNKMRNMPFELGHLEIEYSCDDVKETIDVEVIKTTDGWRILEKLRLVYNDEE